MLNIVLVEPEIPQNCGNIARTCAATRSRLHLVRPLGFDISDKAVKRAGLDYWPMVDLRVYDSLDHFFAVNPRPDLWLATTKAPPGLQPGQLPAGLLADVRQGDRRTARGAAPEVSPQVRAHPHAARRQEPEPGQLGGGPHLRGPAPAGLPRLIGRGRDGLGAQPHNVSVTFF